ncbi:MAG TPA: helix-hairpin-helix domain-containing protein [Actinomycetota bacterium]|nr:helix-hairpin-helix domain-containing protein [Actinomycetota bacterium]
MPEIVIAPHWTDRLDGLMARRREAMVVASVIVLSLAVVLLLRARAAPAAIAPPAVPAIGTPSGTAAAAAPQIVLVHVAGAVRHPGLYELPAGARVADAIDMAGGPRRNAWLDGINLAQVIADGMKIEIPRLGAAAGNVSSSASPSMGSLINLNSADQAALESIPGVGPVTAAAILEHRARVGNFSAVEELLEVSGIGPATLEAIRPYVTV